MGIIKYNMTTINILTLFPTFFVSPLQTSILGKALAKNLLKINLVDLRQFATDKHRTTDDRPFAGGAGMVMKIEPIDRALTSLEVHKGQKNKKIYLLSPRGEKLNQSRVQKLAQLETLTLICGHYGDVDYRVTQHLIDDEISLGDFILTGGEPGALIIADAVGRLLPGVLGNKSSLEGETHSRPGLVAPPAYTRPANYKGWSVPSVLLSGNHREIEKFKRGEGESTLEQD